MFVFTSFNNKTTMKSKVIILLTTLIFISLNLSAQSEKLLSVKQMQKDFDEVLVAVETHPDPYTHISEGDYLSKYKEERKSITQPMTVLDYYKKVAKIVALIKDGHSSTNLPRGWLTKKRKKHGVFPFKVFLTNEDELYITKNYSEHELPVPAKIVALNGTSVDSFINTIDPYISYELTRFRNTVIDDRFEMYLYLAFGSTSNLEMEYVHSDTSKLQVQNIPFADWRH